MSADDGSSEITLFTGFNQDYGCLAIGTSNGFRIFNINPFRETFRRVFSNGIGIVEMLFRCNLIALVGGGRNPRFPTNKVMIWDDNQSKCIGELVFKSEVLNVKLRRDRVVVAVISKVFVYRFSDLVLVDQITTQSNPRGLLSLCVDAANNILAVPGLARGSVRVELYDIGKATIVKAHDAELAHFTLNIDGSKLATASEKGTLVRVWDCHTGEPLRELRRGIDRADIFSIAFNAQSTLLACSSDKGTVHVFSLFSPEFATTQMRPRPPPSSPLSTVEPPVPASSETQENLPHSSSPGSLGIFLKGVLPSALLPKYVSSVWSFAQVRGVEGRSVVGFDRDDACRLHVATTDGVFLACAFDPPPQLRRDGGSVDFQSQNARLTGQTASGGECRRLLTANFLLAPPAASSAPPPPPPSTAEPQKTLLNQSRPEEVGIGSSEEQDSIARTTSTFIAKGQTYSASGS